MRNIQISFNKRDFLTRFPPVIDDLRGSMETPF